jgi:hypothetical protein
MRIEYQWNTREPEGPHVHSTGHIRRPEEKEGEPILFVEVNCYLPQKIHLAAQQAIILKILATAQEFQALWDITQKLPNLENKELYDFLNELPAIAGPKKEFVEQSPLETFKYTDWWNHIHTEEIPQLLWYSSLPITIGTKTSLNLGNLLLLRGLITREVLATATELEPSSPNNKAFLDKKREKQKALDRWNIKPRRTINWFNQPATTKITDIREIAKGIKRYLWILRKTENAKRVQEPKNITNYNRRTLMANKASAHLAELTGRICNRIWLDDIAQDNEVPLAGKKPVDVKPISQKTAYELYHDCFPTWKETMFLSYDQIPPSWALAQIRKEPDLENQWTSDSKNNPEILQRTSSVIDSHLNVKARLQHVKTEQEALRELIRIRPIERLGYSFLQAVIQQNFLPVDWCQREDFHELVTRMIREKAIRPEDFVKNPEVTNYLMRGSLPVCTWLRKHIAENI